MATTYPQGGYQQAQGGQPQPVVLQVIQQKNSSNSFLKACECLAGTGCAICIGIFAGFFVFIGSILLIADFDELMTPGIAMVAIGGFFVIGSCFACSHFRKEMNEDNNVSATLIGGQQQAGRVYNQPQVTASGQPLISPVVPQPPPGAAVYPGPQQQYQPPPGAVYPGPPQQYQPPPGACYPGPQQPQQYPMPPPGYAVPGPVQAPGYSVPPPQQAGGGYIPGQIGGTIPEQPAPQYSTKAGEAAAASAPMAMPTSDQTSEYDRPPAYAP